MVFTVAIALIVSLLSAMVLTPVMLPWLRRWGGQTVRSDGPRTHLDKAGTPTMGGLVFVPAMIAGIIISGGMVNDIAVALIVAAGCGLLGFIDDYAKVSKNRSLGLRARTKVFLSIVIALGLSYYVLSTGGDTAIGVPGLVRAFDLGVFYVPFVVVVLLATTNAVNLTDGLDALASSVTAVAAAGYVFVLWFTGNSQLMPFAAALCGVCIGFLPLNRHPAAVFMGDAGSFALGGALAAMAVLSGTELLLIVVGGVFVVETVSVIAQVITFKATGQRVLLMAPLHHHFELLGWSEPRIVKTMVAAGLLFAVAGIALSLTLRGVGGI